MVCSTASGILSDNSQLLPVETVHSLTGKYFSPNPSSRLVEKVFCLLEIVLFYSEFFLLVETIIETWGISIFKDEIYSC